MYPENQRLERRNPRESLAAQGLATFGGRAMEKHCGRHKVHLHRGHGGDDHLIGGAGRDWLFGRAGDDRLEGGGRQDWLFGGRGDDHLFGDAGRDRLSGGRGDDDLVGGTGKDKVFGGRGNDTFVYRPGDGSDVFFGGRGSGDVIRLDLVADGWKLDLCRGKVLSKDGGNLCLSTGASGTIRLADSSTIRFRDVEQIETSRSNQAPGIDSLSASAVFDNAPEGAIVGKVVAADPDSSDTLTYALVDDAGGRFAVDPTTGRSPWPTLRCSTSSPRTSTASWSRSPMRQA
jgi:hypothetical protein